MKIFSGKSDSLQSAIKFSPILFFLAALNANAAGFITDEQQLSVKEKRAGEAYYRADSKWMIYQAEVADDNPFYQIFLKNIDSGAVTQVSPGTGKTTCAWVHPSQEKVLFSSTHDDKEAKAKMAAEIERRNAGEQKSYAWDYDEYYDIYETDFSGGHIRNLTHTLGYDAEASWSPDGKLIAFDYGNKDDTNVWVVPAQGGKPIQISQLPGGEKNISWSPDSKAFVFTNFQKDMLTLYIAQPDNSEPKPFFETGGNGFGNWSR